MGARKKKARKKKNRAYFMRFNPKMRRRRAAKTDYYARSTLIYQDKDKYCAPKYRMVVRKSNKNITCQVVSSKIIGDEILATAYSSELRRYGIKNGLTNYAACYATGLLLARRVLKKLGLDEIYTGAGKQLVNIILKKEKTMTQKILLLVSWTLVYNQLPQELVSMQL